MNRWETIKRDFTGKIYGQKEGVMWYQLVAEVLSLAVDRDVGRT